MCQNEQISDGELLEIMSLARAASKGPWKAGDTGVVVSASARTVLSYPPFGGSREDIEQSYRDGDYVAKLSPQVVLAMIDEILRARGYGNE